MINFVLYKKNWQLNYKLVLIFLVIITLYSTTVVMMFDPSLGKSLEMMQQSMPKIFSAFGMHNSATSLLSFISNYLYGFLLIVIPIICIIILCNRLLSKYVEQGSMSYLLTTPNTRKRIITTQLFSIFSMLLSMIVYTIVLIIITSVLVFPEELEISTFLILNIGLLGLLTFIASICFLSVCIFNEFKTANMIGGGFSILCILIQMLSQVNHSLEFLKYLTPLTLFNTEGIINGDTSAYLSIVILYIVAAILNTIAIHIFCKKDLPI